MNWEKISRIILNILAIFTVLLVLVGVVGWAFEFVEFLIKQDIFVLLGSLWAVVILIIWWFLE
jgi:hypothetical protein